MSDDYEKYPGVYLGSTSVAKPEQVYADDPLANYDANHQHIFRFDFEDPDGEDPRCSEFILAESFEMAIRRARTGDLLGPNRTLTAIKRVDRYGRDSVIGLPSDENL